MSISIAMFSFQTSSDLKSFRSIRDAYNLAMLFPLLSTPILLFCCAYQREKNVVFSKFKEFDFAVCAINVYILLPFSMLIGMKTNAVYAAVCLYIYTTKGFVISSFFTYILHRFVASSQRCYI